MSDLLTLTDALLGLCPQRSPACCWLFSSLGVCVQGKVSIMAHSLGSVLTYDILCNQPDLYSALNVKPLPGDRQSKAPVSLLCCCQTVCTSVCCLSKSGLACNESNLSCAWDSA